MNTGIQSVEALKDLHLEGNIIPMEWFAHLKFDNGKPDVNAILILSDIVYWYRPVQVRDEETGMVIGYRKKFRSDLLQKSYHHYAALFGLSKRQVIDAVIRLEERGLIKRVLRTVEIPSATIHNVVFIALNVEKVRQLQANVGGLTSYRGGSPVLSGDPPRFNGGPPPIERGTYTETTTKITTEITTENHPHPPPVPRAREVEVEVLDEDEDDDEEVFEKMILAWNTAVQHKINPDQDVFSSRERFQKLEEWQKFFGNSVTWEQYCNKITNSDFLMGENSSGFKVSLEWALNSKNVLKVLEGAIYNKPTKSPNGFLSSNRCEGTYSIQSQKNPSDNRGEDRNTWDRIKAEIQEHSPPSVYMPEWLKVCEVLSKILGPIVFKAWFLKVGLAGLTPDLAILLVDSAFKKSYLENHFQSEVEQAFRTFYPTLKAIKFQVAEPQGENSCLAYR